MDFFWPTHSPYVSINSTESQVRLQFFWPHHSLISVPCNKAYKNKNSSPWEAGEKKQILLYVQEICSQLFSWVEQSINNMSFSMKYKIDGKLKHEGKIGLISYVFQSFWYKANRKISHAENRCKDFFLLKRSVFKTLNLLCSCLVFLT